MYEQDTLFQGVTPDVNRERMAFAFQSILDAGKDKPPEIRTSTEKVHRHGLIVSASSVNRTLIIEKESGPGHIAFPVKSILASEDFTLLLAGWFAMFMSPTTAIARQEQNTFYDLVDTVDGDNSMFTMILGYFPPQDESSIWTLALHNDYLFNNSTPHIVNWIVKHTETKGANSLAGKAALLMASQGGAGFKQITDALYKGGSTQDNMPMYISNLVKWYYFAFRAFLWSYLKLKPQAMHKAQPATLPTFARLGLFYETFMQATEMSLIEIGGK